MALELKNIYNSKCKILGVRKSINILKASFDELGIEAETFSAKC
jgi:hypothetical protein